MCNRVMQVLFLSLLFTGAAFAQQWKWPDKSKNLTVLPPETTGESLRNTMVGFAQSLGVRCWYCHVGEEGKPLSSFDFVSDEKQTKETARLMLRMVKTINESFISKMDKAEHLKVTCLTCHRGNFAPLMLESVLQDTYREKGLSETIQQYRDLRTAYYGSFTYNFGEQTLLDVAGSMDDEKKIGDAIEILKLNLEFYPSSGMTAYQLGDAYEKLGNKADAIKQFEMAVQRMPKNPQAKKRLESLKK